MDSRYHGNLRIIRRTQPPDAENRMSGGVGGLIGAIRLARPDQICYLAGSLYLFQVSWLFCL